MLTVGVAILVGVLVALRAAPLVSRGVMVAVGRYVDLWSISHAVAGVLLALIGLGLIRAIALTVLWEVIEVVSRVRVQPGNRIADVVLALSAWMITAFALGPAPLW